MSEPSKFIVQSEQEIAREARFPEGAGSVLSMKDHEILDWLEINIDRILVRRLPSGQFEFSYLVRRRKDGHLSWSKEYPTLRECVIAANGK